MMTANREALTNHPSDTPWTDEQNTRYAKGRAETIKAAHARAAAKIAKPAPVKTVTLANGDTTVDFLVGTTTVTVKTRPRRDFVKFVKLTIAAARLEYRRLLDAGFRPW